jgi:hypothetical protein
MPYKTHEEHFATVPAEVRTRLVAIQKQVEACVPGATKCISYDMPAFKQQKTFFYFAGFKSTLESIRLFTLTKSSSLRRQSFAGPREICRFPTIRSYRLR